MEIIFFQQQCVYISSYKKNFLNNNLSSNVSIRKKSNKKYFLITRKLLEKKSCHVLI